MDRRKLEVVCIDDGSTAHDSCNRAPVESVALCQLAAISQKAGKLSSCRASTDNDVAPGQMPVPEPGLGSQNTLVGIVRLRRKPVMWHEPEADRDEAVSLMAPDPCGIDHGLRCPYKECPAMEPEGRLFMHDLCRLPDDAVLETPRPKADALRCTSKHLIP